jgi:monoterpene epsilon-lactone hydrolase
MTAQALVPRKVMEAVVRRVLRPVLGPQVPVRLQRAALEAAGRVARLPRGTQLAHVALGGCPAELVTTPGANPRAAVLYLHGGGYTVGSPATHRALAAHLSASSGAPVFALDYRLAPEHPFPAALDDAVTAYQALLDSGLAPHRIAVAGDSAGGGLSLALCHALRDRGIPAPAGLALISPWVDLTLAGVRDDRRDPMLRTAWLRACAARYSAGADLASPLLSPLHGDLSALPPMLMHAASGEILLPDIERFVQRARDAGADVRYRKLDGLWHVAHVHAGLVAESTAAAEEVGHFLRETTLSIRLRGA